MCYPGASLMLPIISLKKQKQNIEFENVELCS